VWEGERCKFVHVYMYVCVHLHREEREIKNTPVQSLAINRKEDVAMLNLLNLVRLPTRASWHRRVEKHGAAFCNVYVCLCVAAASLVRVRTFNFTENAACTTDAPPRWLL
jgi:hypothetical protein